MYTQKTRRHGGSRRLSRSPRRVRLHSNSAGILGAAQHHNGHIVNDPNLTASGYLARVKAAQSLRRRPQTYKEFVKTLTAFNASNGADRMELIEKMITSLDGNRLLISELGIVLPSEYIIEIQQDAVVIKVVDSGNKTRDLVDTGHSRSITNTPRSNRALDPLSTVPLTAGVGRGMERMSINAEDAPYGSLKFGLSEKRRLNYTKRSYSSPRPIQWTGTPRTRNRQVHRSMKRSGSVSPPRRYVHFYRSTDYPQNQSLRSIGSTLYATADEPRARRDGTMAYINDVKEATSRRPETYNRFITALERYHAGDTGVKDTAHNIVDILHSYPSLVLAFNEFLPRGHRIRALDSSAYVLEYPGFGGRTEQEVLSNN